MQFSFLIASVDLEDFLRLLVLTAYLKRQRHPRGMAPMISSNRNRAILQELP